MFCRRNTASNSPPKPGSAAMRRRCAAGCSARSRESSPATIATPSTTWRYRWLHLLVRRRAPRGRRHRAHPRGGAGSVVGFAPCRRARLSPNRRRSASSLIRLAVCVRACPRLPALLCPCAEPERAAVPAPALAHHRGDRSPWPAASLYAGRSRHYPPIADAETGFLSLPKTAA